MADFFQSWLELALATPAVLACGVLDQNEGFAARTTQEGIPETKVQEIMRRLSDTVRLLQQNQVDCDRLCWNLEVGQLYSVLRPDGTMGMIIAGYDPGALPEIERLIRDFQSA